MNDDTSKRLDSIEKAILSVQAAIVSMEKSVVSMEKALIETRTKLDTVLPHLATKAELEAVRTDLIRWVIGAAVTSAGVTAAITTVASHVNWH
jgi:hypothetical protein